MRIPKPKKAQSAVETMFVVAISSALLLPAIYVFYDFLQSSSGEIIDNQINQIGNGFVENAGMMYNYGNNARINVDYAFPDKIHNMSIERNRVLRITIGTKSGERDYTYSFDHNVTATFVPHDWQSGKKTFEFRTIKKGEVVLITKI